MKRRAAKPADQPGRAAKSEKPVVVGARVRELYEARGWTQQELAWRANLSLPKVSRVVTETQGSVVPLCRSCRPSWGTPRRR